MGFISLSGASLWATRPSPTSIPPYLVLSPPSACACWPHKKSHNADGWIWMRWIHPSAADIHPATVVDSGRVRELGKLCLGGVWGVWCVETVWMHSRACFDSWRARTETWCGVNGHEAYPLALSSHWVVESPSRIDRFNICFPRALVPATSTDTLLGRKRRSERDLASVN